MITIDLNSNQSSQRGSLFSLEYQGIRNCGKVACNSVVAELYQKIICRNEGTVLNDGAIMVDTGHHQKGSETELHLVSITDMAPSHTVGNDIQMMSPLRFSTLYQSVLGYLQQRDLFVQDCYAGSKDHAKLYLRIITEHAWQSLQARILYNSAESSVEYRQFIPEFTVISLPSFEIEEESNSTGGDSSIIISVDKRICLICGAAQPDAMRLAVATICNMMLTEENILGLRCASSRVKNGETALFFGEEDAIRNFLSPELELLGGFHGWAASGLFPFESGLVVNLHNIRPEDEGILNDRLTDFGTLLINSNLTGAFAKQCHAVIPLYELKSTNQVSSQHPKQIFFQIEDNSGVLPLIAHLSPEQAAFYFLAGKLSSDTDRTSQILPCFGASPPGIDPCRIAERFLHKVARYETDCWLVNTGRVGRSDKKLPVGVLRSAIKSANDGMLLSKTFSIDPTFGFGTIESINGLPGELLHPELTWSDRNSYNEARRVLVSSFSDNFEQFRSSSPAEIARAEPGTKEFVTHSKR